MLAHSDGVESERIDRACMVAMFRVGVNWLCLHGRKSPVHVQGFVEVSLPAIGGRKPASRQTRVMVAQCGQCPMFLDVDLLESW